MDLASLHGSGPRCRLFRFSNPLFACNGGSNHNGAHPDWPKGGLEVTSQPCQCLRTADTGYHPLPLWSPIMVPLLQGLGQQGVGHWQGLPSALSQGPPPQSAQTQAGAGVFRKPSCSSAVMPGPSRPERKERGLLVPSLEDFSVPRSSRGFLRCCRARQGS